jgi:hypothetical protein
MSCYDVHGRLRIPSEELDGRKAAREAAALASAIPGVESAEVCPTGSVLIYHDPHSVKPNAVRHLLLVHGCLKVRSRTVRRRWNPTSPIVSTLVRAVLVGLARS